MVEPASVVKSVVNETDPLDSSYWRPLRLLLAAMDDDIAQLYAEAGVTGMRTRFVGPMIRLARHGSLTIKELADALQVSHSAMSQTVAAMRRAGLVASAEGSDGRTRVVRLTDRGRDLVPMLEAEWRATEAAVRELDAEIPYPLRQVVDDLNAALSRRSFRRRLREHLGGTLARPAG